MSKKNKTKIKLMKSTFYKENEAKEKLINFIRNSDKLSMGEEVKKWETSFSLWQNRKYSIAVNSGSSANLLLIQSLLNMNKLHKGDKVAFSSVTWSTNVMPILQLGLIPIAVDIELNTLNVSSQKFKNILKDHSDIKCLFITNLLGFCDDLDVISKMCDNLNIILIEDNCESLGSEYKNKKLGNYGLASTFSTFVGHHMSTIEGGLVCTDNEELSDHITMARAHGWGRNLNDEKRLKLKDDNKINNFNEAYTFYNLGFNLRPTELTGVLGCHELGYLSETIKLRENNFLSMHNSSILNDNLYHLNVSHMNIISNFAFPIIVKSIEYKKKIIKIFYDNNIEIRPLVAGSILRQPFFKNINYQNKNNLINSDIINNLGFYIPNNPELNNEEVNVLVNLLRI